MDVLGRGEEHQASQPKVSTRARRWGSTTHAAPVAAMWRTAGSSFAAHPCATQRRPRNDVRLVSGIAGKLTVAASRPPWITTHRVVIWEY